MVEPSVENHTSSYSRFVRRVRLILPVVALSMAAVVFVWSTLEDKTVRPLTQEQELPKTVGVNELLSPRFESRDDHKNPYVVTAKRAVQGKDEHVIVLEQPEAGMTLGNGHEIAAAATQGAYDRDQQRLFLEGEVRLFHDEGYRLDTQTLKVDFDRSMAVAEQPVRGKGPAGVLNAQGLKANAAAGHLMFVGPVKVELNRHVSGAVKP